MTNRVIFIIVAVVLVAAGLYFRSQNSKSAKAQVAQILNLDTDASDTATPIANLKTYVNGHMGASAVFTLDGAYQRAQTAAGAAAAQAAANAQVYAAAQAACSGHTDSITQAECNQRYLSQHLVTETPAGTSTTPQLVDYQYNLRAPFWTPDAAGACLLGAALAAAAAIVTFLRSKRKAI